MRILILRKWNKTLSEIFPLKNYALPFNVGFLVYLYRNCKVLEVYLRQYNIIILQVLSSDIVDWMNFVVFLNAWNQNSHEIGFSARETWNLVNCLLKKYILEKITSIGPLVSSPGSNLPVLVQLITEPVSWHSLVIQSCARTLVPSGKKKKKSGSADQNTNLQSHEIQDSIQSLCDIIGEVTKWVNVQIKEPDDKKFESIFSSLQRNEHSQGPGKIVFMLENFISSANDVQLGDRIFQALQQWSAADVARKILAGQRTLLSEFLRICEVKVKSLQALKVHL